MLLDKSYIILDAARMGADIETAKKLNHDYISLFRGKSEESLEVVAPFLFSFNPGSEFATWFQNEGWGKAWGILFTSTSEQNLLVSHFQNILFEKTKDRGDFYFRFYDPRVLRIFLTTCTAPQLNHIFSPVGFFICEDEDPASGLKFFLINGELKTEKNKKEKILTFHPER